MKKLFLILLPILFGAGVSWMVAGLLIAPVPGAITPPTTDLPIEPIELKSTSGSILSGWKINASEPKGVILLFHGIRGNRLSMLSRADMLYKHNYSTVLIDFQAHGESTGEHITIGHLEKQDVRATLAYAKKSFPDAPIGIIGTSMGGAAAILASPLDVDALVIESVYSNIRNAVHNRVKMRLGVLSWLPAELLLAQLQPRLGIKIEDLNPIGSIEKVQCPIFVISGRNDQHTTLEEAQRIYSAASAPKQLWLVDDVAHDNIYQFAPEEYTQKVIGFFEEHLSKHKGGQSSNISI